MNCITRFRPDPMPDPKTVLSLPLSIYRNLVVIESGDAEIDSSRVWYYYCTDLGVLPTDVLKVTLPDDTVIEVEQGWHV